ncbi:hypothetical protein, partial [Citrobacter youngae]|uniref:hypothetical protein n=1 Tax=Citrobacter youngae TaxID=133448 RepID=UPI003EDFE051
RQTHCTTKPAFASRPPAQLISWGGAKISSTIASTSRFAGDAFNRGFNFHKRPHVLSQVINAQESKKSFKFKMLLVFFNKENGYLFVL